MRRNLSCPGRLATGSPYRKLEEILGRPFIPRTRQCQLAQTCDKLEERGAWLQRLRRGLQLRHGPVPLSTEPRLSGEALGMGRRKFDGFLAKVKQVPGAKRTLRYDLEMAAKELKTMREELFAPSVVVEEGGRRVVCPMLMATA